MPCAAGGQLKLPHNASCPPNFACRDCSGDSAGNHEIPRSSPSHRAVAKHVSECYRGKCRATFSARLRKLPSQGDVVATAEQRDSYSGGRSRRQVDINLIFMDGCMDNENARRLMMTPSSELVQ